MPLQQVPNDQIIASGAATAPVVAVIAATNDTNLGTIGVRGANCGDRFVAKFTFRRRTQCQCGRPVYTTLPDAFKFIFGCEDIEYQYAANLAGVEVYKVHDGETMLAAPPTNPATAVAVNWSSVVGEVHDVHFSFGAQDLNEGC